MIKALLILFIGTALAQDNGPKQRVDLFVSTIELEKFPIVVTRGRITIQITKFKRLKDNTIEFFVAVTRDGTKLKIDEHQIVVNPPVHLYDVNGNIEQKLTDRKGVTRIVKMKVDPLAVLVSILLDKAQAL